MNKEEVEYTIKTNRNTGEIVFSRGDYGFKQWGLTHEVIDLIEYLQQENKKLKEEVENKDRWFQLIVNMGFDYDGLNKVESLKGLIDELVRYSLNGRDNYNYEETLFEGDSNE